MYRLYSSARSLSAWDKAMCNSDHVFTVFSLFGFNAEIRVVKVLFIDVYSEKRHEELITSTARLQV